MQIPGNVWKGWMETVEPQKISPEAEYSQVSWNQEAWDVRMIVDMQGFSSIWGISCCTPLVASTLWVYKGQQGATKSMEHKLQLPSTMNSVCNHNLLADHCDHDGCGEVHVPAVNLGGRTPAGTHGKDAELALSVMV
jgi:hypothetical protein